MKTIGIIGGMGPMATIDLFAKLTRMTAANTDQEHARVVIDSNTEIPDRTAAILSHGESPLPQLVRSALNLEAMGADVLIMACNTAHYFIEDIRKYTRVPLLHMIEETASEAVKRGYRQVGLLATTGTYRTGIYDQAFSGAGVKLVKPGIGMEMPIMDMIYKGVKAGAMTYPVGDIQRVLDFMKQGGAEAFVLGCTELPLAFDTYELDETVIDPTEILAKRALEFVGMKVIGRR